MASAFGADFWFDRHMPPAADDVTSLSAIGGSAYRGTAFTTTHWSVVLEAQGPSPAAQEALEKLCRTYWQPIYGFVRRQGAGSEEAKDLTQGFLCAAAGTPRSGRCAQRERALAFLPADIAETFPD